jgi:hypothetical protein
MPKGDFMGITLVIVGGLAVISAIAMLGDYLTKTKIARTKDNPQAMQALQQRLEALEALVGEQDKKIAQLEGDISFATKLLEDKSR